MGHGQERTQVQKEATRTCRLGERIQGSKARSGKQDRFTRMRHAS